MHAFTVREHRVSEQDTKQQTSNHQCSESKDIYNERFNEYSDPDTDLDYSEGDEAYEEIMDVDSRNFDHPEKLPKYAETIFAIAHREIPAIGVSSRDQFTSTQRELTPMMYQIAVKWLFLIQQEYAMSSNTLFTAVTLLNTALSRQPVSKDRMQLVTVTCLWIASKMEERAVPKLEQLCAMCQHTYSSDDFVQCERELIVTLDFRFNYPTSKLFLRRLLDVADVDNEIMEAACFFCDVSLNLVEMWSFPQNVIALASVCLGMICLGFMCPTKKLCVAGHVDDVDEVRACARLLLEYARYVKNEGSRHFLFQRYTCDVLTKAITRMNMADSLIAYVTA